MLVSIKSFTTASLNLSMETSAREGRREKEREGGSGGGGAGGGGGEGVVRKHNLCLTMDTGVLSFGKGGGGWVDVKCERRKGNVL